VGPGHGCLLTFNNLGRCRVDSFIVRPKRRLVEKYAETKAWEKLGMEQQIELASDVAGLPSELVDDDQDAKQFDLLMLRLQLAVLLHQPSYQRLRKKVNASPVARICPRTRRKETGRAIPLGPPQGTTSVAQHCGAVIWSPFWCTPPSKTVAICLTQ